MPKLSFLLATALNLGLSLSLAGTAFAEERYMTRPPVVVSPDLTAPWIMQLTGQNVQPAVNTRRIVIRQRVQQRRVLHGAAAFVCFLGGLGGQAVGDGGILAVLVDGGGCLLHGG